MIIYRGAFIQPTIFKNVPLTSPIYEEEAFGPVVIVNTFRNEDEAVAEANSVEYGLFCASLFYLLSLEFAVYLF
jgi:aldehyde dehydrogenase (NAD+)